MRAKPSDTEITAIAADALVVPYFEAEPLGPAAVAVDQALDGILSQMRASHEATGKFPQRTVVPTLGRLPTPRVVFLGLGRPQELDGYRLRNALQLTVRQVRRFCPRLALLVDPGLVAELAAQDPLQGETLAVCRAIAEGVALGNYHVGQLKTGEDTSEIEELEVVGLGTASGIGDALNEGVEMGEVTNRARVLQWQPSNLLTPTQLAAEAERVAKDGKLEIEVLERGDMEKLGMGALAAVARGSHQPPKLVYLRYRPKAKSDSKKVLGLVGKGITFDSGGISLKPNPGMSDMKADMSGAAAVIETMTLIAKMQAPIEVIAVAALTENMPGGGAIKPGDVVTAMNGKTIEINNTDAEGRLVLADGLCYAAKRGASHLITVATLTGSAVVAMGRVVTAAMGTSPQLLEQLRRAGALAGERIAELPMTPEYDIALITDIADMHNTAGTTGDAGSIYAAVFLREFTNDLPWVHLDIAGTAYHTADLLGRLVPKGPSGVMTRTLAHLPFQML
ncbi:MAG: leucyl aminopeptidase [Candidatus Dormiibacterota bacterium]